MQCISTIEKGNKSKLDGAFFSYDIGERGGGGGRGEMGDGGRWREEKDGGVSYDLEEPRAGTFSKRPPMKLVAFSKSQ